jgi:hypothetical protein
LCYDKPTWHKEEAYFNARSFSSILSITWDFCVSFSNIVHDMTIAGYAAPVKSFQTFE